MKLHNKYINLVGVNSTHFLKNMNMTSLKQFLKTIPTEFTHRGEIYFLMLVTDTNIYFGNPEEGDDNGNTICFDLDMKLLSDNIHACNAMLTDLEDGNYVWIKEELNEYRKEMFNVPLPRKD